MHKRDQKVIAVVAERTFSNILGAVAEVDGKADIIQYRFDCLKPGQLSSHNIRLLRHAPSSAQTMASFRHITSVNENRLDFEGFKYRDHPLEEEPQKRDGDPDLDRIYWLRKAVQETRMQFYEIEHDRRKGLIYGDLFAPQSVVRYTNLQKTPSLQELLGLYTEIAKKGADHIVFETLIREQGKDKGRADKEALFELGRHAVIQRAPVTLLGLGKYGSRVNLESYKEGLSEFLYGIVPSRILSFPAVKLAHPNLPTLDKVLKELL